MIGLHKFCGFGHRPYGDLTGRCGHQWEPFADSGHKGMRVRTAHVGVTEIPESLIQDEVVAHETVAYLREHMRARGTVDSDLVQRLAEHIVQVFGNSISRVRFRSSSNVDDAIEFNGAGLYDSFTHHPDEGHLSMSILQVFASLWNFRAYEERENKE